MAFDTKYYCEWKDIHNLTWRADIEKDGSFTATSMQATGNPLTIEYLSSTDDIHQDPVKGSMANLNIYADNNFQWSEFYAVQDREYRMSIYYNDGSDHLYWRGFIISDNYSEPYNGVSYPTTISASCGLGALKNYLYKYKTTIEDDTYYNGRRLESQVILDILGKLGITTFTEFINIYENSMVSTVNDSPMDQIKIDVDVFKDMYCYEVLSEILNKYGACIRSIAGMMTIYRPTDLNQITIYGRIFSTTLPKTSTTNTPAQFINRTQNTSDIRDTEGGTLMPKSPAKKVTLNQDYGYKDSWIDNWQPKLNSFTLSGGYYDLANWTKAAGCNVDVMNFAGESGDGMFIGTHNISPSLTYYMYQDFGVYAITSADIFNIELEYLFYNASTLETGVHFYVEISNGANYLHILDEDYCHWQSGAAYIDLVADAPMGSTGWMSFSRRITGIPADGTYRIKVFGLWSTIPNVYPAIKNIKFYNTSDEIVTKFTRRKFKIFGFISGYYRKLKAYTELQDNPEIVQKQYIGTNAINGNEIEYALILGDVTDANIDNILEQFAGSLGTYITTLLHRVDEVTLISDTGAGEAEITCNGITKTAIWNTSLTQTALDFISYHGSEFTGITVATGGAEIIRFTHNTAGATLTTSIVNTIWDLEGSIANTQPDLSSTVFTYSTTWSTRSPGGEADPLLEIIATDITLQMSRPRQYIQQLPVIEGKTNILPHINLLGNFQDELNIDDSDFLIKTVAGWTKVYCTLVLTAGYARLTTTANNALIYKTVSFHGGTHSILSIKYKWISGTACQGWIYYSTSGHGTSGSHYKELPIFNIDGAWHTLLLDMSALTLGGTDWIDNIITQVVIQLNNTAEKIIDIDWIGFDRRFVFNTGVFNARDRQWNMDLIEIL
jgi:hypothetical protein